MYFDPVYLVFALPGILLAMYASFKVKSTFNKYSRVASSTGVSGAESARRVLHAAGIDDVASEQTGGFLSDHYDPMKRVLRLSPGVYQGRGLSSIGVACHEAGHAIQHKAGYAWMHLRTAMVPATNISSWMSYIVIMLGFMLSSQRFILFGAVLFSAAVLFSIVTLPVEWDASSRAKKLMVEAGVVGSGEAVAAGRVLNAAFLTYVAAAVSSLLTLLYYLMRAGVLGRRRD